MKIVAKSTRLIKVATEALIVFVSTQGWEKEITAIEGLPVKELLADLRTGQFSGKKGSIHHFSTRGKLATPAVWIVGVGKDSTVKLNVICDAAATIVRSARRMKRTQLAIDLTTPLFTKFPAHQIAKAVVEGFLLGGYEFVKYKSKPEPEVLSNVHLLVHPSQLTHTANGIFEGEIYSQATIFARDLVNEPPSITTPSFLAEKAKQLGRKKGVMVEIIDKKELARMGMSSYLAVSRGSDEAPKFIKLTYKGGRKKVVIAGKAITFDTGGLSLKDAKNMETMKLDMAGGAAILGVFSVLAELKPAVTVVGLIAACENMPGPRAMKPGDIVTALNGKTIEILNTDAEGRLTLADVLSYSVLEKPDAIVDLATLTGACMVALGEDIAGMFSNSDALSNELMKQSGVEGEKLWRLPLEETYRDLVKSDVADLRNIAKNRYGGAITAALFLEEFVDKIPWAHLDIAGPSFAEKDSPLIPKGGVGFGVRTLLNWLTGFTK